MLHLRLISFSPSHTEVSGCSYLLKHFATRGSCIIKNMLCPGLSFSGKRSSGSQPEIQLCHMDYPCFLKRSVPLLLKFLGPESRDYPAYHHCCCSAEGRPCRTADLRVCLEQVAGAQTKEDSSCRTHYPDVETPLKAKAHLQQLLLEIVLKLLNIEAECCVAMPGMSRRSQPSQRVISG